MLIFRLIFESAQNKNGYQNTMFIAKYRIMLVFYKMKDIQKNLLLFLNSKIKIPNQIRDLDIKINSECR